MASENSGTVTYSIDKARHMAVVVGARAQGGERADSAITELAALRRKRAKFEPAVSKAVYEGKEPPAAARDLDRRIEELERWLAVWPTVRAELDRAVSLKAAEWEKANAARAVAETTKRLGEIAELARGLQERLRDYRGHRADLAAPTLPYLYPPELLPNLPARLDCLLEQISQCPPEPRPVDPGLVVVRMLRRTLPANASNHAVKRLQQCSADRGYLGLDRFCVGELVGLPEEAVCALEELHVVMRWEAPLEAPPDPLLGPAAMDDYRRRHRMTLESWQANGALISEQDAESEEVTS